MIYLGFFVFFRVIVFFDIILFIYRGRVGFWYGGIWGLFIWTVFWGFVIRFVSFGEIEVWELVLR